MSKDENVIMQGSWWLILHFLGIFVVKKLGHSESGDTRHTSCSRSSTDQLVRPEVEGSGSLVPKCNEASLPKSL